MVQSPLKPVKKPHPLNTLGSIVELVNLLMERAIRMISPHRHQIMLNLCSSASKIFSGVSNDKLVWSLITNFNETIHSAIQVSVFKKTIFCANMYHCNITLATYMYVCTIYFVNV